MKKLKICNLTKTKKSRVYCSVHVIHVYVKWNAGWDSFLEGKKGLSLNFTKRLSVSNHFTKATKAQCLMRKKKRKAMTSFPTKMALKKDVWSKAWCPDGISCKREWSSFTCNLLFSVGTRISTGSFAINSQMVKMNCPINYTSYCMWLVCNHGSLKLSVLNLMNQHVCWVQQQQKLLKRIVWFLVFLRVKRWK